MNQMVESTTLNVSLLKTLFIYLFILPHHKYNINEKKNRKNKIDVTMARRPKGNYEAYIN